MLTVYKYPFHIDDEIEMKMPVGAEVLTVQMQGDGPAIWARVDPTAKMETRPFSVRGTGHPHANGKYVGTFQMRGGALVFHVFDRS